MEHLRVLEHVLAVVDEQLAGDEDDDGGRGGRCGLGVEREDAVLHLGERERLRISVWPKRLESQREKVCV